MVVETPPQYGGLTTDEAHQRLLAEGYNELPGERQRSVIRLFFDVLREPMILLLLAAGGIYLLLGELREAILLLASIGIIIGIEWYQEQRTEHALAALRDLSSPRALVVRDDMSQRIAGRDVVRGDVVLLTEGDRVPADGIVRSAVNLAVDESLLTGESVPVRKRASETDPSLQRPGGDDTPFVYSGTLIVRGHGSAEIGATGARTEMGRIGVALQQVTTEATPLQQEIGQIVKVMALLAVGTCLAAAVLYGVLRGNWLTGVLSGITLAMSLIPEEFPVVLTIFLALGAWRIAQRQVLARRMHSIETLGATTVLCTDKTGTLTQNRMTIAWIHTPNAEYVPDQPMDALPDTVQQVASIGMLASQRAGPDPMDTAFWRFGRAQLPHQADLAEQTNVIREYPLRPDFLAVVQVCQRDGASSYLVAAKGSPETILALCHMDDSTRQQELEMVQCLAADGLRILGVASAHWAHAPLPDDPRAYAFTYAGLVGLADPIRPDVPAAVQDCAQAGVRVVMITGDYPETARAIGRHIGLSETSRVLAGPDLEQMGEPALHQRVADIDIYARVVPEQKLRLVSALKAQGEIVAMTGDGVNDAPALKAAHIGIAMGGRGTDVAREAAGLVLLDDNFASIVAAIALGRRIFDNLRKAMAYIVAVHIPIAGLALLPILFGLPLLLLPVHIVFLELIIDPACSLVFEAEPAEHDVMRRPPRDPHERLFQREVLVVALAQGISVLAITFGMYLISWNQWHDPQEARALAFTTLIIANLGLILMNRSWTRSLLATLRTPNRALWWVVGGAVLFLAAVLAIPFLRDLFQFAPLHGDDLLLCLLAGVGSIAWFEGVKLLWGIRRPACQ